MFISTGTYITELEQLIGENNQLRCAVAFWGKGANNLFIDFAKRGGNLQIICNLESGATNPNVISKLMHLPNVEIRQHNNLHAKVIVGENKVIVGSANFSDNGLNLEGGELIGWEEAGIVTKDLNELEAISLWFNGLWENSCAISTDELREAQELWKSRDGIPILDVSIQELKIRRIFLTIYRNHCSPEAEQIIYEIGTNEVYETWPNLPRKAYLVSLFYPNDGDIEVDRCVYKIIPNNIREFEYDHGEMGQLQICRKVKIPNIRYGTRDARDLQNLLTPAMTSIWMNARGSEEAKVILLSNALEIVHNLE